MGGGGKGYKNDSGKQLDRISGEVWGQVKPIRQQLINTVYAPFLGMSPGQTMGGGGSFVENVYNKIGETDTSAVTGAVTGGKGQGVQSSMAANQGNPASQTVGRLPALMTPIYAPLRAGLENQYRVARDQALSSGLSGGALASLLSGVDRSRAGGVVDLNARATESVINQILGLVGGGTQQALGGYSSAGALEQQRNMAQAQTSAGKGQALGMAAGMGAAGYLGGPAMAGGAAGGKGAAASAPLVLMA